MPERASGGMDIKAYPISDVKGVSGIEIEFSDTVPERCICLRCHKVSPVIYRANCEHGICKNCWDKVERNATVYCPLDNIRSATNDMWEDKSLESKLMEMTVKCQYRQEGCQFSDKLSKLVEHLPRCVHVGATCSWCNGTVPRKSLVTHMESICESRLINCNHCLGDFIASSFQDHDQSCLKKPVSCKHCGQGKIVREELNKHFEVCPKKPKSCKFSDIGCTYLGLPLDLEKHQTAENHFEVLCNKMAELGVSVQNIQRTQNAQNREIQALKNEVRDIKENGTKNSNVESVLNDILSSQNSVAHDVEALNNQVRDFQDFYNDMKTPLNHLIGQLKK